MSKNTAEELMLLPKIKSIGGEGRFMACCPAHEDSNPSLSIKFCEDGTILLKCFAGCTVEEICSAAGISMRDIMARENGAMEGSSKKPVVVARYSYRDEKGDELYQVWRYEPKRFVQMRRLGNKMVSGLGDVRRILYKLPELVKRPSEAVIVVEGEGKVDLLMSHGILATCNPGGAGMGWNDTYSEMLSGRRVIVIPDNNGIGKKHASNVIGSLIRKKAKAIMYLELMDLAEGEDIANWFRNGHSKRELVKLIHDSPRWIMTEGKS